MPMIRYQIRNVYGLADPELHGTAERDDPEALLEGVAMAGLVGVLRQLGDLAEFAAEIFHDLHEEVMGTAARGHGLMLRVQQLEAELPSIEKAFFTQTNYSSFACNDGIDWHANIQMDQNLITQGDLPCFILDSYEECRGPPQLLTLDKFDVAGAGACLKRYSDPSFFKMELAFSGMLETELPREKKARKIKKKGSRWQNGRTLESLLAPHADSDLQPITSDQVSKKTSRHVRLKSRHSNGLDKSNESSLMERLLEISSEQKVLFGNSIGNSHVKINPIDSKESAPEIFEIVVDSSADRLLVKDTNLIQSPMRKEVAGLPLYELETQKTKKKDLSGAPHGSFGELKITDPDYHVVEQKEMSTESGYKSEGSVNGYAFGETEKTPLALQVIDQNKLLGDAECISEGGAGGYRSNDISSDLDNFVDALNTMKSEIETDSECRPKADPGVFDMKSHGNDSDTNEAQQELQAQFSEPHSVDNSTKSLGSDNMFKNEKTSLSDSDASNSAVAQPTQRDIVSLDLTAHSEICPGKTCNKTTETDSEDTAKSYLGVFIMESHGKDSDSNEAQQELQTQFSEPDSVNNSTDSFSLNNMFKNEMTCFSGSDTTTSSIVAQPTQRNMVSIDLPANSKTCPGKIHDRITEEFWQNDEVMELNSSGHLVSSSCVRDSTSVIVSVHHQGSCHESQSVTGDQNDLTSGHEASEADEATKYLDGLSLESDHLDVPHPTEHVEELTSEDMAETFGMPDHLSQTECRSMSGEAPAGYIEDSMLPTTSFIIGESQELAEPDARACSCGGKSSTISVFSPDINSIASQPDSFATELENSVQPEDIVAERSSGCMEDTHDIAEDFNRSSLGTKDEDVPEKIHPSDYSTELNPEDMAITLDMTNHHSQTQDECIPEKVPTGFVEDSALPSTEHIVEPQDSMKQDTEACLGWIISPTIPALPLDISFTVQPGHLAAEMENVVAPSEHLTCSSSTVGLQNAEEMDEVNISVPNTLAPELEYSNTEELQEFPCVISAGFTHLRSVEKTCPSDILLQCDVLDYEVMECPISVDDNLKLLDEPTEHISQENILQTGGPTQFYDLVSENAIFDDNSDNSHSSSTYSTETSGLQVQSQQNSILDDAALYQHQVEKQEALTPKDTAVLDCQSIQYMTLPLSKECQLVSALTAFDPGFSILDSSDPSDSRLLSDVCRTKSSELVQTDLLSNYDEANSVYSLESKQDFGSKTLLDGGCENTEEKKPPPTYFLSVLTIPLAEAASKLQVGNEPNVFSVAQEGEHRHAPTSSIDLNDEPLEQGPELRSHDPASNGDLSELVVPPSNKPMCSQVEPEDSVCSVCSAELISCSLASNVSTVLLPSFTSLDVAILETPQLPFEPRSDKPVSSFPLQDVEEPPSLPPLPPLEWRKGKLQLGSISSVGNLFQPLSGTNPSMPPSATDWKHGHGLLADEGEMVKPANPFVTLMVLEAKSSQHDLLKSEGEKMHPFRLSELPPIVGDERYQHDAPFLEGKIVHPSNPSLVVPPLEDKHPESHNSVGEVMLQPSNSFASLSVLEDEISRHSLPLHGGTLQPPEDTCPRLDQLLPSSELERSQESGHSHLSLERETIHPPNTFLVQSDIEDEKHHYGNGICGVENMHLLQSSVPVPTTGPELPKPGYVTSREHKRSSQFDLLPTPDEENLIVKPHSIRNRPRDPLIEAVAAHDRSTLKKVSEMVQRSNKPKADEMDSLLEQIRNKSFNLKPTVVRKPNNNGHLTNLKVAAIIEKVNAIRQAFVGSDEDDVEDSWSDS